MSSKPKIVIAGPGAGKTYGMVQTIIEHLPDLHPAKYMAVITFTNSATNNIKSRLSRHIKIPENLFIGTIHSFMNRFIVIPCGSFGEAKVGVDKKFIQCQTDDVLQRKIKLDDKEYDTQAKAILRRRIKDRLIELGYITFDQTLDVAAKTIEDKASGDMICNRIQYLFVDEFQDTNNKVFQVIERIRKNKCTRIYMVGDPEQFITSYDSSVKIFNNIPILKAAGQRTYEVEINNTNRRSTQTIVKFLNNFNKRKFGDYTFQQVAISKEEGAPVRFIDDFHEVSPLIEKFYAICDQAKINKNDRIILAKKNNIVNRIAAALNNEFISPETQGSGSFIRPFVDTLLSSVQLTEKEFCEKHSCHRMKIREYAVQLLFAIHNQEIENETEYITFIKDKFGLEYVNGIPIKLKNLKTRSTSLGTQNLVIVGNIHKIKGLEADAVLAIAQSEAELLLWLETDVEKRDEQRTRESQDHPRLGYVAFSRAKKVLCLCCLEPISTETKELLKSFDVDIITNAETEPKIKPLF